MSKYFVSTTMALLIYLFSQIILPVSSNPNPHTDTTPTLHRSNKKLSPIRRAPYHHQRDTVDKNVFIPKNFTVIEYGHNGSSSYPIAIVSFDASTTHPLVTVDAFDSLLQSIQCASPTVGESVIHIEFISTDAVAQAWGAWNAFRQFHIVTSHQGCNPQDELGAWRVHAIASNFTNQISVNLSVEKISLNQLGAYTVALLGHEMTGAWEPPLNQNTLLERRTSFSPSLNKNYSGTEIFPGDLASDLPQEIQEKMRSANLIIECAQCSINFNFTVDVNISMSLSGLNLTAMSATATVNSFDQSILLGFSTSGELTLSPSRDLFDISLLGLEIPELLNIGPEVGISADMDLEVSGDLNFTMGAKASITPGTWATFDFLTQTETDKGWNTTKFESIPLKIQSGSLGASITATLSPFIGIGITLPFSNEPLLEARITQNAPSIVFASNLAANVNRNCEPVGPNDFESFEAAYQLSANMTFGTHIGLVGELSNDLPPWDTVYGHGTFAMYNNTGEEGNKTCFVIVNTNAVDPSAKVSIGVSGPLMTAAPTGTLLAAASALPTFDVPKIESYFSANGHLPTNVNYAQLAQVTSIPVNIQTEVQKAAQSQTATPNSNSKNAAAGLGSSVGYKLACYYLALVLYYSVA